MHFSAPLRGVAALGLVAAAAFAVPALAQDPNNPDLPKITVKAKVKVTPKKVGTPKHPQGVKVVVDGQLISEDGFERPIVERGRLLLGKGGLWNGAKYPKCTASILNRKGLKACPKG